MRWCNIMCINVNGYCATYVGWPQLRVTGPCAPHPRNPNNGIKQNLCFCFANSIKCIYLRCGRLDENHNFAITCFRQNKTTTNVWSDCRVLSMSETRVADRGRLQKYPIQCLQRLSLCTMSQTKTGTTLLFLIH